MKYRPDIDGLRAISVLLVILYHANFFWIQSGFIGVDIFFTISGYLITKGIKIALENNQFSLSTFYKKRLLRLQPALICLLIFTTVITTIIYIPKDYLNFTESLRWVTQLQSNIYFSTLKTGYFSESTNIIPLLHTWSLSIEWQWYFILPIIILIGHKTCHIKNIHYWLTPLTIIMILLTLHSSMVSAASEHYYSFLARISEMLIGASLGIQNKTQRPLNNFLCIMIGAVALIIIFYFSLSKLSDNYPNHYALFVCMSAVTIIYIGTANPNNLISKMLSNKLLVYIGLISYSLYIWHWPLFAFSRYLGIYETLLIKIIIIFITFIMAYFSWKYLEVPFQKKYFLKIPLWKSLLLLLLVPYTLALTLNHLNTKHLGYPKRLGEIFKHRAVIDQEFKSIAQARFMCIDQPNMGKNCIIGQTNSKAYALMIGDSHANHMWSFINTLGENGNIAISNTSISNCLALPNIYQQYEGKFHQECLQKTKSDYKKIQSKKYDYVIIGQVWSNYINNIQSPNMYYWSKEKGIKTYDPKEIIRYSLDDSLSLITQTGATPIIINNIYIPNKYKNPFYPKKIDAYSCQKNINTTHFLKNPDINDNSCNFVDEIEKDSTYIWFNQLLTTFKKQYPTLIIIDLRKLQCPNNKCHTLIDNYPIYRDDIGHITDYASYQLGLHYIKNNINPLKKDN